MVPLPFKEKKTKIFLSSIKTKVAYHSYKISLKTFFLPKIGLALKGLIALANKNVFNLDLNVAMEAISLTISTQFMGNLLTS